MYEELTEAQRKFIWAIEYSRKAASEAAASAKAVRRAAERAEGSADVAKAAAAKVEEIVWAAMEFTQANT